MILDKINYIKQNDLSKIITHIQDILTEKKKGYACVVNAAVMVKCFSHEDYKQIILKADFNFCDGVLSKNIYNITQKDSVQKISGPDFFYHAIQDKRVKHCFVGGTEEIRKGLLKNLKKCNRNLKESDFFVPPFLPVHQFNYPEIADFINKINPDLIWISLGNPKQEEFISKLLPFIENGFLIPVGAAFGFYSGIQQHKNAPRWIHQLNLVWLYRTWQEPKRIIPRHFNTILKIPEIIFKELFL